MGWTANNALAMAAATTVFAVFAVFAVVVVLAGGSNSTMHVYVNTYTNIVVPACNNTFSRW